MNKNFENFLSQTNVKKTQKILYGILKLLLNT